MDHKKSDARELICLMKYSVRQPHFETKQGIMDHDLKEPPPSFYMFSCHVKRLRTVVFPLELKKNENVLIFNFG